MMTGIIYHWLSYSFSENLRILTKLIVSRINLFDFSIQASLLRLQNLSNQQQTLNPPTSFVSSKPYLFSLKLGKLPTQ